MIFTLNRNWSAILSRTSLPLSSLFAFLFFDPFDEELAVLLFRVNSLADEQSIHGIDSSHECFIPGSKFRGLFVSHRLTPNGICRRFNSGKTSRDFFVFMGTARRSPA